MRVGKTLALYNRHEALVVEFSVFGYKHYLPLDKSLATGSGQQEVFIDTAAEQKLF